MAWVTKDSVEQYETPESKKEYTKQEKAANWWHYHKLYVGIAVIAVVLVVWMVHDVVTRVRPDYRVGYVGDTGYSFGCHCHFEMFGPGGRFSAQLLFPTL